MKWQKRLSAILCAVLVAFSCFFQAFSIEAWAVDPEQDIALYGNYATYSVTSSVEYTGLQGIPGSAVVPSGERSTVSYLCAYTTGQYSNPAPLRVITTGMNFNTATYAPSNYDRWMVLALGYDYAPTYSNSTSFDVQYLEYNGSGVYKTKSGGGKNINYITFFDRRSGTTSYLDVVEVLLPAKSTTVKFRPSANYYTQSEVHDNVRFCVYSSWVWDDHSTIDVLNNMLTYLKSMDAELDTQTALLRTINSTTSSIYDLLKNALADESAQLSSASAAAAESIMQQDDSQRYWSEKNTENFQAIGLGNFTFNASVISGFSAVGAVFQNLWNALGDVTLMYTFPLILGISLVVIGRVARSGGKGKGSGKDG